MVETSVANNKDQKKEAPAQEGSSAATEQAIPDKPRPPEEGVKQVRSKPKKEAIGIVEFSKRIDIDSDRRQSAYDMGGNPAFLAYSKKDGEKYIAVVCDPVYVPRHNKIGAYESIISTNLCKVIDYGPVYWPPAEQERFVFVYQGEIGQRFLDPKKKPALGLNQDDVMKSILPSLVSALQDFRDKDFVHGSIRPDNIFVTSNKGNKGNKGIVLGDCLSAPSSVFQPVLYETIERGMCEPIARGPGFQRDDLYSLGVTLAVLMRTHDPLEGLSGEEIVHKKIMLGSYAAIIERERFAGGTLEVLRGLLNDDPDDRWTIDDLVAWMDGRRLSPSQGGKKLKAQRPLRFAGKKHIYPDILAMDFGKNITEVRRIVEDGELNNWVSRSLERKHMVEQIELAVGLASVKGKSGGYQERLVACVSAAFQPRAPIRFHGRQMNIDGIGSALAKAYYMKDDLNVFTALFSQNIVMSWARLQGDASVDLPNLIQKFDNCRSYVSNTKLGYGMERCLYTLNTEARCMSDKLKDYYVQGPEEVLYAFEDLCAKGKLNGLPIDRHIAAFLLSKHNKCIESYLLDLNSGTNYRQILANLRCFADIQRMFRLPLFPSLAQYFSGVVEPIYKRFHDKKIRESLKKNVNASAIEGDLVKMVDVLVSSETGNNDMRGFKMAMKEYAGLENEKEKLETSMEDKDSFGKQTGYEFAAYIACLISALIILIVGFLYLSDKSLL